MILLIWATLPDINRLWPDPDTAWAVYLSLGEVCKALACLYLVRGVIGGSGALWFITQALNEATGLNAWPQDGWVEYALFAVLCVATWLYHRHHR